MVTTSILVLFASVYGCLCEVDQLAVADTAISSPLAQLLATASGGSSAPILPLAPQHFRPKRKPQQRFRPRFKPRKGAATRDQEEESNEIQATEAPTLRRKFGGFSRRNRPAVGRFTPAELPAAVTPTAVFEPTTVAPKFQLEDFFGTPQPEEATVLPPNPIEDNSILEDVRAKTIAITGAQPVGVTKDISTNRIKGARQLGARTSARQFAPNQARPFDLTESLEEESRFLAEEEAEATGSRRSEGRRQQRPRTRQQDRPQKTDQIKAEPVRKLNRGRKNNHVVGTVERYRFENEDGGITWGYENEDGSYKEEVIGLDCITQGKYGYIDPTGEVREYTYSSGIRCDPDTRQVDQSSTNNGRGPNGNGFFDYAQNKFVRPDGRRVRVVVNPQNRARGRRY